MDPLRLAAQLVGRGRRYRWLIVVAIAIVASLVELASVSVILVLTALLAGSDGTPQAALASGFLQFVDRALGSRSIVGLAVVLGLFFVTRAILQVMAAYVQARVAENEAAHISTSLAATYVAAPYETHLGRSSAELIRNSYSVPQQLATQVLIPLAQIVSDVVLIVALLVFLFSFALVPSLVALGAISLVAILLLALVQPRIRTVGERAHQLRQVTLRLLQQTFGTLREIKLSGTESHFVDEYASARAPLARVQYVFAVLTQVPRAVIELAVVVLVLVLLVIFASIDSLDSAGALSRLSVFAYAGLRLVPSVQRVVGSLNSMKFSAEPLEEITRDLRAVRDRDNDAVETEQVHPDWSTLRLDSVGFRYVGASRPALADVSLTVRRGESIGICGKTGGGKTTLANLMIGLLMPTEGTIRIDGLDLARCRADWQRKIGLVPQDVVLLDDSIRRNVAFGLDDDEVDEDRLREALELAQLWEWVSQLPERVETRVGERGVKLSGGQRQRVGIARALYRRPSIIVFDEGTSALDGATETALMSALERLRAGHTLILIAHRLSTVEDCDKIVVVEGGRVAAIGTHGELMRTSPQFRTLAGGASQE